MDTMSLVVSSDSQLSRMSEPMVEETGDQFATSAETTYSCGAFYLAAYESLETWVMKKNPENYDADNVFIDTRCV